MNEPGRYRGWLYAAALYNTVWGTWAIIGPASMLHILDLHVQPLVLWLWIGGAVIGLGTALAAWPGRRRRPIEPVSAPVPVERVPAGVG